MELPQLDSAHLVAVDLLLPTPADVRAVAARLAAADYTHGLVADVLAVPDPSGNLLRFKAV
jgi:hypothetical protein